jgi:glucan biosynthesis protein
MRMAPDTAAEQQLLANIKARLPELEALLERARSEWEYEDFVYRFYHQSFKVYWLQERTQSIVQRLQALAPDRPLDSWFIQIVQEGTGKVFKTEDNKQWTEVTRPILEAFFHARFFLEMAVRYGDLEKPPQILPSGYAALLCLYGLR